tara:strand:- start:69 stop:866 length:798 start_codon:yes stop_codon:yes gene_type:complete
MGNKLILFIIFIFIFRNLVFERFEDLSNLKFYNLYLVVEDKIRSDLTTPKIHYLSPLRSKTLYNFTFNLVYINDLLNINPTVLNKLTLKNYLNEICFISDFNIHESVINLMNNHIINFLKSDRRIGITTPLGEYYELLLNLNKNNFKISFLKNLNYEIDFVKNSIILSLIINKIFEINLNTTKNIKDEIIHMLLEKKWLRLESSKDYDDLDILFESLDETYINYINSHYDLKYDTILNLSIPKIQNLYYRGEILDFKLNLDLFCK